MTPEAIRMLFDYNYWAFGRMWGCVLQLNDAQFTAPIAFSMGEIRNHIVHMMSSSQRWFHRLQGEDAPAHLNFTDYQTRASVKLKWDELQAEALAYVWALDQARLDESISWTLPQRQAKGNSPRWQILLHIVNHSTDHRTQILTLLHNNFHITTVEQDMIVFLTRNNGVIE